MRIFVIGPLPPDVGGGNKGGVASHVWDLSENLAAKGHKVSILPTGYYFKGNCNLAEVEILGQCPVYYQVFRGLLLAFKVALRFNIVAHWKYLIHLFNSSIQIEKVRAQFGIFDVIHVHGLYNGFLAALCLAGNNCKIVVTVHSYHDLLRDDHKKKKSYLYSRIASCADLVVHVSKSDECKGISLGVVSKRNSRIVYNGVGQAEGGLVCERSYDFCFLGGLSPLKRVMFRKTRKLKATSSRSSIVS